MQRIINFNKKKLNEKESSYSTIFNKNYIHRRKWMIDGKVPKNLHEKYEYFIAGSVQDWNPYLEY